MGRPKSKCTIFGDAGMLAQVEVVELHGPGIIWPKGQG